MMTVYSKRQQPHSQRNERPEITHVCRCRVLLKCGARNRWPSRLTPPGVERGQSIGKPRRAFRHAEAPAASVPRCTGIIPETAAPLTEVTCDLIQVTAIGLCKPAILFEHHSF
jgi:hypothetical protein